MKKNISSIGNNMQSENFSQLIGGIQSLINQARTKVRQAADSTLILLNWHIGQMINQEILKAERAGYGQQILTKLAESLQAQYGRGFDKTSLSRMVKFSRFFTSYEIIATLSQQLSWSHIVEILTIKDELKRDFYIALCKQENWGVRTLRSKISGMLYERTAIAKQPEQVILNELEKIKKGESTPLTTFKDPYLLDFLGLKPNFSEEDFEQAILDDLQNFIQEFGDDFCFIARQKRMSTEDTDRYLDLLFFHRGMRRLIALELKLDKFKPEHKGQMEWYLRWLDRYAKKHGEEKPLGIILCADKSEHDIELLELDQSGIHVAQYLTQLPSKVILENKLKEAVELARARLHLTFDETRRKEGDNK